ncbi:hypothetical protein BPODLACK_02353 [Gordonia sp. YY1]|nr:hypothetical protein BPODLACK_02353 [Gordonia sp. YY1]
MLTVAVQPVPRWLRTKGFPGWAAFLTTVRLVYGILIGLFATLVFSVARLATILPDHDEEFVEIITSYQDFLTSHGVSQDQVRTTPRTSHWKANREPGYAPERTFGRLPFDPNLTTTVYR